MGKHDHQIESRAGKGGEKKKRRDRFNKCDAELKGYEYSVPRSCERREADFIGGRHRDQRKQFILSSREGKRQTPNRAQQERKHPWSQQTECILEKKLEAIKKCGFEEFRTHDKEFRKSRQKDRKQFILNTLSEELDVRDRWAEAIPTRPIPQTTKTINLC